MAVVTKLKRVPGRFAWEKDRFRQACEEWFWTAASFFAPALIAFGNGWVIPNPTSPPEDIRLIPNLDSWEALAAALIASLFRGSIKALFWYFTGTLDPSDARDRK